MKGEPPRQHTIIPAPIAVHTLTPAKGATARVQPPAGISPKIVPVRKSYQYGNRTGAKVALVQKVHRCRLCTRTCPACRRSYLAAASSSLPPARLNRVQNDPGKLPGMTDKKESRSHCWRSVGGRWAVKFSRQYRPHYIKNGGFYNAWLYCISIIYRGPVRSGLFLWCRCDVVQRHPVRGWAS